MITVVSGLPRSGTSLMMQMLRAGGMHLLVDDQRPADEGNPNGYFEDARVKRLERDASWIREAEGKVVKVVSLLLQALPREHRYQVVFMERDLEEILASQRKLLRRLGGEGDEDDARLRRSFGQHLERVRAWLAGADHVTTIYCDYSRLVREPERAVADLTSRLEVDLDSTRMIAVVDPALYRQRRGR